MDGNDKRKIWSRASSTTRRRDLNNSTPTGDSDSVTGSSNEAPTSGMIAAASRFVTQQGMTGLRPTQSSFGLNRQYHDKRYYTSAIQSHMLAISDEINNLKRQLIENKLDATNYEECRRQVESHRQQLAEHEEQLLIFNTAIELGMFKGSKKDVDADTDKLKTANHQLISQLESLFSNKLAREEQLSKLEQQIVVEEQLFNDILAKMPQEQQLEYHELRNKNEQYKKEEEYLRNKINHLKNTINMHEEHVVQNEDKRIRYNLMVKLHELTKRRDKITEENKVERTPSQEREYLLEQVKQDILDMETLRAQEQQYKNEIEKLRERFAELEDELSEKNSARLNKYRKLLKRQETLESFLSNYDEIYAEQVAKINELRSNIVFSLQYISGNSADINLEDMDSTKNYEINPNASKDELKQEYKKLTGQLEMLHSINERFQNEITALKEQHENYEEEMKIFKNIDMARDELIDRQQNLEVQRDSLQKVFLATKSAVVEAEKKQQELDMALKYNDAYKEFNELEKKLNELKIDNEKQKVAIDNITGMDGYEKFRSEAMALVQDILSDLKKKSD